MGEHHGVEQSDPPGDRDRGQAGDRYEQVSAEEDRAQGGQVDLVAEAEPVGDQALHHKAAGTGIEGAERGQFDHHLPRAVDAEAPAGARRGRVRRCFHRR
jgi:hypothetical protein